MARPIEFPGPPCRRCGKAMSVDGNNIWRCNRCRRKRKIEMDNGVPYYCIIPDHTDVRYAYNGKPYCQDCRNAAKKQRGKVGVAKLTFESINPAPCEVGCAHLDFCRQTRLTCVAFRRYVYSNITGRPPRTKEEAKFG